jgi:hypothetical protein
MELPKHIVETLFKELIPKGHRLRSHGNKLLMNGRCPICNEGNRKNSMRFYLYEKNGSFNVECKNCFYSKRFTNFLKEYHPDRMDSMKYLYIEKIKDGTIFTKLPDIVEPERLPSDNIHEFLKNFFATSCIKLNEPQDHILKEKLRLNAIKIMNDRFIPERFWKDYYFCFTGNFVWRIILPFVNDKGLFYNFQARDIHPKPDQERKNKKYIFAQFDEMPMPDDKIYNKYNVDKEKTVFICEGILKSLFLPNSIALCNANVRGARSDEIKKIFPKRIWVLDSPWKDKTGLDAAKKLLFDGETCFIFPKEHKDCKDVDELAKKLGVEQIPETMINDNLFSGKTGLVKLQLMTVGINYENK